MAAFKFTFLLFACVLVFQAQAKPQQPHKVGDYLMNIIKQGVKDAEGIIDSILDIAEDIIDAVNKDQWDNLQREVSDLTTDVITESLNEILNILTNIAAQSDDSGKKLADCIKGSEDDIVNVPITFLNDILTHLRDDIINVIKKVSPILDDLKHIQADAKQISDGINDCGDNFLQGVPCMGNVARKLLDLVLSIPEKIKDDAGSVINDLEDLINKIGDQVKVEEPVFYANSGAILEKIAKCAA